MYSPVQDREDETNGTRYDGPVGELERSTEDDVTGKNEDDRSGCDGGETELTSRGQCSGEEGVDGSDDDSAGVRDQYETRGGREGTHSKRLEYKSLRETPT